MHPLSTYLADAEVDGPIARRAGDLAVVRDGDAVGASVAVAHGVVPLAIIVPPVLWRRGEDRMIGGWSGRRWNDG